MVPPRKQPDPSLQHLQTIEAQLIAAAQDREAVVAKLALDRSEREAESKARTRLQRFVYIDLCLSIIAITLMVFLGLGQRTFNHNQHKTNERVTDVLTIVDPNSPRGQAQAKATADFRQNFLEEQECRARRAVQNKPVTPKGTLCSALPDSDKP